MKLIKRIKNAVSAFKDDITFDDVGFWHEFGVKRRGKMSEVTYFTCLKTISEAVAKLPLKLYQDCDSGTRKATDLPLYNILKLSPNKNMTSTTFWATEELIKYHYGNSYVYPYYKNGPHRAPELIILDNNYMQVYDDNAKMISDNGGIWYVYTEPLTGKIFKFSEDEILHFKTYMTFDGIMGLAVKDILSMTVDGAMDSQRFMNKLYKTGLTGKVAVQHTQDLNNENRRKLVSTIEAAAEAENAINFIPIPQGVSIQPLNLKLTDAQFLELRKYTALQIAAAFGIKPNQLNDYEKASYANSEQQQQAFLTDTLLVNLKGIEEELTRKLLTDKQISDGYFFRFNVDVVLRATFSQRMQGYAQGRQNGWLSANDIRDKEDLPFIPAEEGGNAYLVNGNMVPISEVMKNNQREEV